MLDYKNSNTIRIRDVADVFSGFAFKAEDLISEGIPVLKIANIQDKKVIKSTVSFFPIAKYKEKLSRYLYQQSDVLVAMTGEGSVGKFGKMLEVDKQYLVNQRVGILRPNIIDIDPEYFYQVLTLPQYEEALYQLGLGAGQPNVSPKDIGSLYIPFPALQLQQRIASILSAYDALIEVNNQRIKLLEESARELYKEWFVRMRFPGYKQTKFVKGVPDGWEVKPMASLCSRITDGTHDTPKPLENGYQLITGKHIIDGFIDFTSAYYISEKDHKQISRRSGLNKGDILLSNIGTIGSASIVDYENEFSVKNVIIYKPLKIEYTAFIYYYLTNPTTVEQFMSDAFGTSQQFLSLGYCRKLKAFIPGEDLILKFGEHINPMIKLKYTLQLQNIQLRQIRDRLLPRLISGKLEVKELLTQTKEKV